MLLYFFRGNFVDFAEESKEWRDELFEFIICVDFYTLVEDVDQTVDVDGGHILGKQSTDIVLCFEGEIHESIN